RSRVVRRRDRRGHRRAARQFPAGVHAPRPDRCGARARGARPRGRRETDTRSPFGGATMNWGSWLIWGFASTVVLTTILAGSPGLGLTRMILPYMLGTLVTPNRDRAKLCGVALHLVNGWIFSLIYVGAFHVTGVFTAWFGAAIGLVHGA